MEKVSERSCPQCGSALQLTDYRHGTVWECGTHGIRDWIFEEDPRAFIVMR